MKSKGSLNSTKMIECREYQADVIKLSMQNAISQNELIYSKVSLETMQDECIRALVMRLSTYVHAMPAETISIHKKWPKDWWQAFKGRWFPSWLLNRYPVQYERIDVDKTLHMAMCPHLVTEKQGAHLNWLAMMHENYQEEKTRSVK